MAAEFALVAADPGKLEMAADEGNRRASLGRRLLRRLSFHLAGAQLGITVTSLAIGILARPVVAELIMPLVDPFVGETAIQAVALATAFVVATIVQMVLAELFPKGLAIAHPERTTRALAPALNAYGKIFGPFIRFLDGGANRVVRRLGLEPSEELSQVRSLSELELLIKASAEQGVLAGSASVLLKRSIRFGRKTAAEALVPRMSVEALATENTVADLVSRSLATGFSRFPVYGMDIDDIRGVVHVRAAHSIPSQLRSQTSIVDIMDEVPEVPETRELEDVLADMRRIHRHLMIVVDEYGGTAGIITLEDLLEEIVGEIDDEHDPDSDTAHDSENDREQVRDMANPSQIEQLGICRLDGLLHPDEVEDRTGLRIPDGEYETLAGFILDRLGHLPAVGESVTYGGWRFEVAEIDRRRISQVDVSNEEGRDLSIGRGDAEGDRR